ncbi:sulfotransferase family 2 domain-containing protein [Pseudoalteromonas maricaloris]|uniref:sulfotransferase family 2 domain-containing protein n=1 Tax=Pseudoalteromonas maricaloris TaxID=184924 RepID=UPI00029AE83D|nr:sulfotransferase family 2 domain-containing protein [Pseudoalteromonas flavipulchra]
MAFFKSIKQRQLLVTNKKVMYTSLTCAQTLEEIDLAQFKALFDEGWPILQLVRNPVDRVVSFYKDKIIDAGRRNDNGKIQIQNCQYMLLAMMQMELSLETTVADILAGLRAVRFDVFALKMLPHLYPHTKHLTPQYAILPEEIREALNDNNYRVVKMENSEQLSKELTPLGVDVGVIHNQSKVNTQVELEERVSVFIKNLYTQDYGEYQYE